MNPDAASESQPTPEDLQREVRFLKSQLDQMAGGQLRADSQLSRLRYELRQRKQGTELLSKLLLSLDVTSEVADIYAKLCQQTCATMKADRAVLLLPAEQPDTFRAQHCSGYSIKDAARIGERLVVLPRPFDNRQAHLLLTREAVPDPLAQEVSRTLEIPFLIAVPIMDGSRVASVLVIGRHKEVKPFSPPFDAGDVSSLQALTGFVAAAIQNVALYQLQRREQFVRDTFGRYLSDQVVAQLLGDPKGLSMGGELRPLTILMSDLRGFTQLSESLAPSQVVPLLNHYLGEMTEVIQRWQGTIDEFIGDAVMVIFGAPVSQFDHAERAVACALEMQMAMRQVNAWNQAQGLPELQMGIGINTGEAIVGNIGSSLRAKYGAVGRVVNIASRVESFTKGGQILLSESTRRAVSAPLRVDSEFQVRAKGVEGQLTLFEAGGLGEPYHLALPQATEPARVTVAPPIPVRWALIDGKSLAETWHAAHIVAGSKLSAEVRGGPPLAALVNLVLRLQDGPGAGVDIYAKSLGDGGVAPGGFVVHFTSLPEAPRAALAAATQSILQAGDESALLQP